MDARLWLLSVFISVALADDQIRLVPGNYGDTPGGVRGRLEVFHNGQWGSICNKNWNWESQNVACQQLGYIKAIHVQNNYKYNDGAAPKVWLNKIKCTGNEKSLLDCPHDPWGVLADRPCRSSRRDAGIWCLTKVVRPVSEVGCYIDFANKRALTDMYAYLRHEINWYDLKSMVGKCAEGALAKGYRYFGVQYFGECWGDKGDNPPFLAKQYPKNNMKYCPQGVGDKIHNMVYELAPWESMGCWKDKRNPRAMTLLKNMRNNIDWLDMTNMVRQCYVVAKAAKYQYFSIQFYGECWASMDEGYKMHGESNKCWNGVGANWSNNVYKVLW